MNGPFPLATVIERAQQVSALRVVGNSADLDSAQETPPTAVPAMYVVMEEQGDNALGVTGLPIQNITTTVKLVLWVRNAGGAAQLVAAMSALEAEVRRVFFGWRPSPEFKPLTIRASGAERSYGSHLIRQLLLTTSYRQTAEGTP